MKRMVSHKPAFSMPTAFRGMLIVTSVPAPTSVSGMFPNRVLPRRRRFIGLATDNNSFIPNSGTISASSVRETLEPSPCASIRGQPEPAQIPRQAHQSIRCTATCDQHTAKNASAESSASPFAGSLEEGRPCCPENARQPRNVAEHPQSHSTACANPGPRIVVINNFRAPYADMSA